MIWLIINIFITFSCGISTPTSCNSQLNLDQGLNFDSNLDWTAFSEIESPLFLFSVSRDREGQALFIEFLDYTNYLVYEKKLEGSKSEKNAETFQTQELLVKILEEAMQQNEGKRRLTLKDYEFGQEIIRDSKLGLNFMKDGVISISFARLDEKVIQTIKLAKIRRMSFCQRNNLFLSLKIQQLYKRHQIITQNYNIVTNLAVNQGKQILKLKKEIRKASVLDQNMNLQPQLNGPMKGEDLLDKNSPSLPYFFVKDHRIIRNFDKPYWLQIVLNMDVPHDKIFSIMFQITNSLGASIIIGVVEKQIGRNSLATVVGDYAESPIAYWGGLKSKYPGAIEEGNGFDQGDVVEVVVNRKKGEIKWYVNQKLEASHTSSLLTTPDINYIPVIQMYTLEQSVEYLRHQIYSPKQ